MRLNGMSKALRFLQITDERQDCRFFYRISNHKIFIPKDEAKLESDPA